MLSRIKPLCIHRTSLIVARKEKIPRLEAATSFT
jgi:hypothetical protein